MDHPVLVTDRQKTIPTWDATFGRSVDLTSPVNQKILKQQPQIRDKQQSLLRDKVGEEKGMAYLLCSDAIPSDCTEDNSKAVSDKWLKSPAQIKRTASDLETVMHAADMHTQVENNGFWSNFTLARVVSGYRQTSEALMLAYNNLYWETVTRPFEKQLVDSLANSSGSISHITLMKTALSVCGNDLQLAILTLANFTKNMAAIERRQVIQEDIAPELQSTYQKSIIDPIFQRIEGFADTRSEQYNKEGAIYHFYGAMLAASQWGTTANYLVDCDNKALKAGDASDRVKDAAGLAGARIGCHFTKSLPSSLFLSVLRFGGWLVRPCD